MSWSVNQSIDSPRRTPLERTFKLEAKRKNAKYQENMIRTTWNLDLFKNLVVSWIHVLFVLCVLRLSNDTMEPKLERQLQSKHPDLAKKPFDYFQRMRDNMQKQVGALKSMVVEDKSLLKAFYLRALQIAKNKKPYTIGEELIKPCMLQACEEILGKKAVQKQSNSYVC